jgi:uncharacterized protein YqgC (DUF456 family)
MANPKSTHRLSIISFVCGLVALISIGSIFAGYNMTEPTPAILFITDGILMPIRNISVLVALVTGILALRDIKKKGSSEKGQWLAWAGIVISAFIILSGVLVSLVFLLSRILQSW